MAFPTRDAPCVMTPKHTLHSTTSPLVPQRGALGPATSTPWRGSGPQVPENGPRPTTPQRGLQTPTPQLLCTDVLDDVPLMLCVGCVGVPSCATDAHRRGEARSTSAAPPHLLSHAPPATATPQSKDFCSYHKMTCLHGKTLWNTRRI